MTSAVQLAALLLFVRGNVSISELNFVSKSICQHANCFLQFMNHKSQLVKSNARAPPILLHPLFRLQLHNNRNTNKNNRKSMQSLARWNYSRHRQHQRNVKAVRYKDKDCAPLYEAIATVANDNSMISFMP